ncbi:hypothetical protein AVEN_9850-1 [Araneus ventricosus]|uniref:Uncharacterized protein n=1 Tax=Araneus ventricosus TaxID=182803 RepID=A0A4Y2EDG6_ARAVE|nr:hypothetical protein AVEN_9850-1 [Araneus ventricosus]
MNVNTELLDDTLDEIFEEINSEDYNENEMEELETEVSEDTERWADDGDLKKKSFFRATQAGYYYGILSHKNVRPTSGKTFPSQTILSHATSTHGVQSSYLYEVTDFYYKHAFFN